MALFGLFRKKNDVQKDIEEMEKEESNRKVCARCGHKYPLEEENCSKCGTKLYIENENFCTNPNCERSAARYRYSHDDFFCTECKVPTVVGDICGFNDLAK